MKKSMLAVGLLILVFSLLIFGVFAQTAKPDPDAPYPLPVPESDNCKKTSADLRGLIYTNYLGMDHGTLYGQNGGRWHPSFDTPLVGKGRRSTASQST